MKKLLILIFLVAFLSSAFAGNDTKKAIKSVDRILNEDDKGKGKGGKPNNPGSQGRRNAEIKQATNPGKGGGKNSSLGGALIDELIDDDDKGKGGKNKKKGGKNK